MGRKTDRDEQFHIALENLRGKFPEYYIEAWSPDDFKTTTEHTLTHDDCCTIANNLYEAFDANVGTTWERVACAVEQWIPDEKEEY